MTALKERLEATKDWVFQERHRKAVRHVTRKSLRLFTAHPAETSETYWGHMRFTLGLAVRILVAGFCVLVHGIFPFIFRHTTSRQIEEIYVIIKNRLSKDRKEELDVVYEI